MVIPWHCDNLLFVLFCIGMAFAECECGYRVPYGGNSSSEHSSLLFTDAIQVNFRTLQDIAHSKDWKIKYLRFNYVPNSGRFGKRVEARNIIANPLVNASAGWNSASKLGGDIDAGLQLIVRSNLIEGNLVSTGQIQSKREDIRFGSFRTYMRTTAINGTCASHFWYNSDSKEIDVELLSRQQDASKKPANLVVHSNQSVADGNDARGTAGYIEGKLSFDPSDGFHEYRYDWSSDLVSFYADGKWLGDVNSSIPADPGIVQLSHWSDGNPGWTAGPPAQDAILTVAYYFAYFNSTDTKRMQTFEAQCSDEGASAKVCDVLDFGMSLNASQGPSFVGSTQNNGGNKAVGISVAFDREGILVILLVAFLTGLVNCL